MKKYLAECVLLGDPIEQAISEDEITAVLSVAQRRFHILDIIAPDKPLRILRLSNSHKEMNSAYGVPTTLNSAGTIMLYHPRDIEVHDRIFIFAHELGHALHFAMTKDIDVFPDGVDKLNELFGMRNLSSKEKR
jgi:hypothetical protein